MSDTIQINREEYDKALQSIRDMQVRSSGNNDNYKGDIIEKTDAVCVRNYRDGIERFKSYLSQYNNALNRDLEKLASIADVVEEFDKKVANQ